MMRSLAQLLKVQLLGFFPINRLRYTSDKKEKRQASMMAFAYLLVAAVFVFYSYMLSSLLADAGLASALPPMMLMSTALVTLMFTLMKSSSTLFGFRDYDIVMSLPVRSSTVILSRLVPLYAGNVGFDLLIFLPAFIVYAGAVQAGAVTWIMMALIVLLSPLIPMAVGLILGAVISAISGRLRHKNVFVIIFTTLAIALIFVISFFGSQVVQTDFLFSLTRMMVNMVGSIYPPALWISDALQNGAWSSLLLFAFVSLGIMILFVVLLSLCYRRLNSMLSAKKTGAAYRMKPLSVSSPFMALYKKELRRLISSPSYLLNSCVGFLFYIAMGALIRLILPMDTLMLEPDFEAFAPFIWRLAPWLAAFFMGISSTTTSAISLEGKSRYLMCSAPVSTQTILNAKLWLNLSISLSACLIGSTLMAIGLLISGIDILFLFLLPIAYGVFTSVFGLFINLKYPKYDWTTENQALKQSAAVLITIGVGMFSAMAFLVLTIFFLEYYVLIYTAVILLLLGFSVLFYRRMCKRRIYM